MSRAGNERGLGRRGKAREVLLLGGAAGAILYIASDIIAATLLYPGYSYVDMQVSELSALGAPSRPFWMVMSLAWGALTMGAGCAVATDARLGRRARATGMLLALFGLFGVFWVFLAPMSPRGGETKATDIAHLAFTVGQVLLMVCFIALGSSRLGRGFGLYSCATIVAMLAFGAWTGTAVPAIAAGRTTPWMGLVERVAVYCPIVWALAFFLLSLPGRGAIGNQDQTPGGKRLG